ncbi:olfactory receptor-like protein OLF3 [Hemicordylus capensis]|uniref:olfactory receptor-like protein OLF3 n=1 Tax=Hemicordylus capensis TaxID=884348 RepID=UPI0023021878|nr:olfactory receptor-like protein OLF3 [Hemicordylus capensis]
MMYESGYNMGRGNKTWNVEFVLLGLSAQPGTQKGLFVLFLMMYIVTMAGNTLIILVLKKDPCLHTPMYYFLSHLSFLDMCYTTTIIPQMLSNFLAEHKTISFEGCMAQMYISLSLGGIEFILLAVMAYDRYMAICHPLHYNTVMSWRLCMQMAGGCWLSGFVNALVQTVFTLHLPYCGKRIINHFGCEVLAVQQLACSSTFVGDAVMLGAGVLILLTPFFLVLVSYVYILSTILQIRSAEGRRKAFSTCTAHLTVVTLCYGTAIFAYLRPRSHYSAKQGKTASLFYCVVTPMLNPMIYSLRNQEVKGALVKVIGGKCKRRTLLCF